MKIKDFGVEIWMGLYENDCDYNLAETCVESLTVNQLLNYTDNREKILDEIYNMKLTYGEIEGSVKLRNEISTLYEKVDIENITVTHGAIGANSLSIETLVDAGDTVISVLPTYQQHYSIPESIGANVKILKLRPENEFLPDLEELKSYIDDKTKLICINNPNNPTGALMDEEFLNEIVDIAKECDAYILCDEVYRGLNHNGENFTKSIFDLYEKGISTGSMSKTFSLAGLRIGWVVGPKDFIKKVNKRRDYNIISCGMIDDRLSVVALENKEKIIKRNLDIVRGNAQLVDEWVKNEHLIEYIKPKAGTTAFLKYDFDMKSEEFCLRLLKEKSVMLVPGSALDMEGYVRLGFANNPEIIKVGLKKISEFLKELKIGKSNV
ncbi:MAG: aminotransferase [Tepidibacter sp.]|jgi:aspartate/methionine/tyrosine aminotransferase|uniref:aminotransferase n=1 Tax=Tepidibacter sp. TaxID=2529387 RepID=UPI0025D54A62|nr:aminotransferase [Tepidibacter sp.]MCT4508275.1 aminotransferase [Tepidibacter sp.]